MDAYLSKFLAKNPSYRGVLCLSEQGLLLGSKGEVPPSSAVYHDLIASCAAIDSSSKSPCVCIESNMRTTIIKRKHKLTLVVFKSAAGR
eukprot:GDKH01000246.1.p2 GENE.GDKH01000246.1~~GDKH01000246.1.p2  ORF type:complete len:89 (-),score=1.70 GDKH01000246.1:91-357(-)